MVTLRDIADQLEISPALVSRVLNRKPGAWANKALTEQIHAMALKLDYRPSASARALATGRTMHIAVALQIRGEADTPAGNHSHGLVEAAAERGYRMITVPLRDRESGARKIEELAQERVCDGVCLFSAMSDASYLRALEARKMPVVMIGDLPAELEDQARFAVCVDHDNYRIAYDATAWLKQQNHKRIAWVRALREADQSHSRELRRGYSEALQGMHAPLYLDDSEDVQATLEAALAQGATAMVVRWLSSGMRWARALRATHAKGIALMLLMDEEELPIMHQSGLGEGAACLAWSERRAGRIAATALLDWIETGQPETHSILVAPSAPGWMKDRDIEDRY